MAKPIPRIGSRRSGARFVSRLRRLRSRKSARRISKGTVHIQAASSNTIVTVTDIKGRVVFWNSAGTSKFKGTRKKTPYAAQVIASNAIRTVMHQGMQRAAVMIKGSGRGRDAALRAICRSGIRLSCIRDVTPMPHNGCRPPKKRYV
uniref:Small ribosomal subunit protein uS11c n=1 Tax=Trichopetalum plumosum TaxID=1133518 RepID=H2F801_9ASPA|nr:ribosomal protein S11 [Trichopetalum plumosum]